MHILVHICFPLTPANTPPRSSCQNIKSLPFPCFPILFAQSRRHSTLHRRLSHSSNTTALTPLLSDSLLYPDYNFERGRGVLGMLGSAQLTIVSRIYKHWCHPGAGSLSSRSINLPDYTKTHGHSTVTMAQALNTVFVCQLL